LHFLNSSFLLSLFGIFRVLKGDFVLHDDDIVLLYVGELGFNQYVHLVAQVSISLPAPEFRSIQFPLVRILELNLHYFVCKVEGLLTVFDVLAGV